MIFSDCFVQGMATFSVVSENFRPGRRQKNLSMKSRPAAERFGYFNACGMLQGNSRIDKSAVKENPVFCSSVNFPVSVGHVDRPQRECFKIDPRQSFTVAKHFLRDDPSARLCDGIKTATVQFS